MLFRSLRESLLALDGSLADLFTLLQEESHKHIAEHRRFVAFPSRMTSLLRADLLRSRELLEFKNSLGLDDSRTASIRPRSNASHFSRRAHYAPEDPSRVYGDPGEEVRSFRRRFRRLNRRSRAESLPPGIAFSRASSRVGIRAILQRRRGLFSYFSW